MLSYNLDRVIKARGIDHLFSFLKKHGFSSGFASRIKNNRIKQLRMGDLERLCLLFRCTPNDLMAWAPDENTGSYEQHPLTQLIRSDKVLNLTQMLNSVPLEKLDMLEKFVAEQLKTQND